MITEIIYLDLLWGFWDFDGIKCLTGYWENLVVHAVLVLIERLESFIFFNELSDDRVIALFYCKQTGRSLDFPPYPLDFASCTFFSVCVGSGYTKNCKQLPK